jgi:predicted RNA methylase
MFLLVLSICVGVAIVVVSIYFFIVFVAWNYSEGLDIPFVPTPLYAIPLIAEKLAIRKNDVVYDIGCGNGRLIFYCAKRNPDAKFIGIELNPLLCTWMRLRKFFTRAQNVEIRQENIFSTDISDATKIYAFLLQDLTDKFFNENELRGVRVVSRAFRINRAKPKEIIRVTPHDISYGGHLAYVYDL